MLSAWVNGEPATGLSIQDRGLQYGDGLFETMRVAASGVRLLDRHMARLALGCTRLGIPLPGPQLLRAELATAAAVPGTGVIKLILTRGEGGRGYRAPATPGATRIVLSYPAPTHALEWSTDGIAVRYCTTRLAIQPLLAGLKHLNRLEQVCARNEWTDASPQEGLMMDTDGRVVCGTMSNLFVIRGAQWRTPRLDRCGVAGTMRAALLDAAAAAGVDCAEADLTRADVDAAEEVFLSNAVLGACPVRELEGRRLGQESGVRLAQAWIRALG